MPNTANIQQNLIPGVQNLNIDDDKTPLMSAPQVSNVQPEYPQGVPPPFLSGVPMVNPGSYIPPPGGVTTIPPPITPQQQAGQQVISSQQPMSQAQSVVSNMAAYSSSKYNLFWFLCHTVCF